MERIYFDNAASTPIFPQVAETMAEILKTDYGNPSSIHQHGRNTRSKIEEARKKVAGFLNASIGEIFFTSGGTEANNMVLKCSVRDLNVRRIITSKIEHHCILHTVERLGMEGIEVDYVQVDPMGQPDLDHLRSLLQTDQRQTLVSLMHGNNEVGTMIDLKEVGDLCREYEGFFHSDTVQTVGHYALDLSATPVHAISGSAHKFHGPKGVGFVYIRQGTKMGPLLDGGSQERNMRAGTENISGICGLAEALKICYDDLENLTTSIRDLRQYAMEQLQSAIPGVTFNGCLDRSLYTVLSVNFPDTSSSSLLTFNLDIEGISASGGSACSSGTENRSHVMTQLNPDFTGTTVRFSFSAMNTRAEIDYLIQKLTKILKLSG